MKIKYPFNIDSNIKKHCYVYRLQELKRLEAKVVKQQWIDNKISDREWQEYQDEFEKISSLMVTDILLFRKLAKEDKTFDKAKLSDNFE